jgi:hypothetical protein
VTREEGITALCERAHRGELAAGYIAAGKTLDEVKASILFIRAVDDLAADRHTIKPPAGGWQLDPPAGGWQLDPPAQGNRSDDDETL